MMKKWVPFLLVVFLFVCSRAAADPLILDDDLADTITIYFDEYDPTAGSFTYSYRYPHIDDSEPDAGAVNPFYSDLIETDETNINFMADGYAASGISIIIKYSYRIMCNNDEFFSVLILRESETATSHDIVWRGDTFSRRNQSLDSTFDLPRLLGILDSAEQNEYMVERQTGKAVDVVLRLIMDQIEEKKDEIPFFSGISVNYLRDYIFPQEEFYLNVDGDPVFFIAPGIVADASLGYLTFTISVEDILDEL